MRFAYPSPSPATLAPGGSAGAPAARTDRDTGERNDGVPYARRWPRSGWGSEQDRSGSVTPRLFAGGAATGLATWILGTGTAAAEAAHDDLRRLWAPGRRGPQCRRRWPRSTPDSRGTLGGPGVMKRPRLTGTVGDGVTKRHAGRDRYADRPEVVAQPVEGGCPASTRPSAASSALPAGALADRHHDHLAQPPPDRRGGDGRDHAAVQTDGLPQAVDFASKLWLHEFAAGPTSTTSPCRPDGHGGPRARRQQPAGSRVSPLQAYLADRVRFTGVEVVKEPGLRHLGDRLHRRHGRPLPRPRRPHRRHPPTEGRHRRTRSTPAGWTTPATTPSRSAAARRPTSRPLSRQVVCRRTSSPRSGSRASPCSAPTASWSTPTPSRTPTRPASACSPTSAAATPATSSSRATTSTASARSGSSPDDVLWGAGTYASRGRQRRPDGAEPDRR